MKCELLPIFAIVSSVAAYYGVDETNGIDYPNEVRGVIENTINSTLNKIKEKLPEPIVISAAAYDFGEEEALSGSFNITKLMIFGVKDFVATKISAHIFREELDMTIVVPEVSAQFKYWADMVLLDLVPLYGQGRMSVNFDEIEIGVKGVATWTKEVKIKDIVLVITLKEATFHLDGMLNNPEYSALVSTILSDNFAEFLDKNAALISKIVSPIVQAIINYYLEPKEEIQIRDVNLLVK